MSLVNSKKGILILILIILLILVPYYFKDLMTIDNLKENQKGLTHFVDEYFMTTIIIFIILTIICVNSPLPLAAFIEILGGVLFGFYLGFIINVIAVTLACFVGYVISKHFLQDYFKEHFKKKLSKVNREIINNGFYYFLSMRFAAVVPYFLINVFGGISKVKFKSYFSSTIIGVIPYALAYAYGGSTLDTISAYADILTLNMLVFLLVISALSLIPVIIRNYITHKHFLAQK